MSRWLAQTRLAFRSVFRRKRVDQELDEELRTTWNARLTRD
jgi:hypothetical protein